MKLLSNYQASYIYLAQVYMQEGKNEEAARQLERLNKLVPSDDWRTYMFTAQLYYNMKKYPEAAEYTKKAIGLNPQNTQARLQLPGILQRAGNVPEAVAVFRKLIEEQPDLAQAYTGLADLYAKEKDYSQAIEVLRGWLVRKPNDAAVSKKIQEYELAAAGTPALSDTVPR
jgi:tetratricopeptide (TPR) repeat protein